MTLAQAGLYVAAYLIGSVPTGFWLGKAWKGVDVRKQGSGNLGATNVFRVLGPAPGALTLAFDIAKGLTTVCLSYRLFPDDLLTALVTGLCTIAGHTMSIFVRLRGGKGVATSAGVFLALLPAPSLAALGAFAVVLAKTRYVSAGSLAGALTLALSAHFMNVPVPLRWAATAVALFVFWTHRTNLKRLQKGTENRLSWKKKAA